jgi:hypothetical protein
VEEEYYNTVEALYMQTVEAFTVLATELQRFGDTLANDPEGQAVVADKTGRVKRSVESLTRNDVDDFHFYYTVRSLYAQVGADEYVKAYDRIKPLAEQCEQIPTVMGLICPPVTVDRKMGVAALYRHADNVFSSVSTAGAPFPLWSEGDGTGSLLAGNSPVGGSGIDMSAALDSLSVYLDVSRYGQQDWAPLYEGGADGYADPLSNSSKWENLVEKNPMFA